MRRIGSTTPQVRRRVESFERWLSIQLAFTAAGGAYSHAYRCSTAVSGRSDHRSGAPDLEACDSLSHCCNRMGRQGSSTGCGVVRLSQLLTVGFACADSQSFPATRWSMAGGRRQNMAIKRSRTPSKLAIRFKGLGRMGSLLRSMSMMTTPRVCRFACASNKPGSLACTDARCNWRCQ